MLLSAHIKRFSVFCIQDFFNTEFEMLRNFIYCSNMLEAEVDSVPTLYINYSRNPKKVENQEEAFGKFPDFGEI